MKFKSTKFKSTKFKSTIVSFMAVIIAGLLITGCGSDLYQIKPEGQADKDKAQAADGQKEPTKEQDQEKNQEQDQDQEKDQEADKSADSESSSASAESEAEATKESDTNANSKDATADEAQNENQEQTATDQAATDQESKDKAATENNPTDQQSESVDTAATSSVIGELTEYDANSVTDDQGNTETGQENGETEKADPQSQQYTTGIVAVAPEGDMWRVVDKHGKIFRVSTNSPNIGVGSVSKEVIVSIKDGEYSLKLTTGFSKPSSPIQVQAGSDMAGSALAEKILQYYQNQKNEIRSYEIKQVTSQVIGKGVQLVNVKYDVELSPSSSWKQTGERSLSFPIFGYESQWLLPSMVEIK